MKGISQIPKGYRVKAWAISTMFDEGRTFLGWGCWNNSFAHSMMQDNPSKIAVFPSRKIARAWLNTGCYRGQTRVEAVWIEVEWRKFA